MKVAYLSESPADEAAIRILVEAILRRPTEPITPPLRSRGWPSVRDLLPSVLKHLHYRTDADALVVVADSNRSAVYPAEERRGLQTKEQCRLVQLQKVLAQTQGQLRPVPNRQPIRIAIGLAVPAIEAWYLCGRDPNVSENAWVQGLRSGNLPYTKNELKRRVYGMDRPFLRLETQRAAEETRRLADDLAQLERLFPYGFGCLARDVGAW